MVLVTFLLIFRFISHSACLTKSIFIILLQGEGELLRLQWFTESQLCPSSFRLVDRHMRVMLPSLHLLLRNFHSCNQRSTFNRSKFC